MIIDIIFVAILVLTLIFSIMMAVIDDDVESFAVGIVILFFELIFIGAFWIGFYSVQLGNYNKINVAPQQIALSQKKADDIGSLIKAELDKYPAIEQKIIGHITPQIILSYPQLHSDQTIMAEAQQLSDLNSAIFTLKSQLIDKCQSFKTNKENIFYPKFFVNRSIPSVCKGIG